MLMLCITGLPLIFHEEIDEALGAKPEPDAVSASAPLLSLDRILEIARAQRPGEAITFAVPDDDGDPLWYLFVAPALNSPKVTAVVDEKVIKKPKSVQVQFRYAYVCDEEGIKVLDVTDLAKPVAKSMVRLHHAHNVYLARTYGERKRSFVGQHFWARGFYVSTVGRDEQAIREYIKNQEQEDMRLEQLNLWR